MIYFLYDDDGYYLGNDSIQSGNCTDIEPTLVEGYWSRFDGTQWTTEKIPDSATELEGIVLVSDESLASNHDKEVYSLFQKFLDDTHYIEEDSEKKTLTFKAYSEEELAEQKQQKLSAELRAKRDAELDATDFYLMPDYPISGSDLTLIQRYRQELRDLPQQEGFPYVDFPVNPLTPKVEE